MIFIDTNVLLSALALPGGRGDEALRKIVDGEDAFVLSRPILDELLGVLARKFAHDREVLARVAVFLSEVGEFVEPNESLAVLADEPDNRIPGVRARGWRGARRDGGPRDAGAGRVSRRPHCLAERVSRLT